MKYINLINSFWDLASLNPLSTGQVSLYFALLHVCNRSYWTEWFEVSNQVLSVLTGLSRSGILKARNELKQKGVIDFKERGTRATLYCITIANSKQDSVQDSKQDSKQDSVQDSKQDSVQDSKQDNILRQRQKTNTLPPISPAKQFEFFWACYPLQKNRVAAEKAYCAVVRLGIHGEEDLVKAAENYAEYCKITETDRIYYPANFLSKTAFEDYLPDRYKKPKRRGKIEQHEYDFEQLEKELLEAGGKG